MPLWRRLNIVKVVLHLKHCAAILLQRSRIGCCVAAGCNRVVICCTLRLARCMPHIAGAMV